MQLRDGDPLEERFREMLGLPRESPDPDGLVWEEDGPAPLRGAEREREWRRWHEEDRRADLARFLSRVLRPQDALQRLATEASRWSSRRALARAPWIRFEATHRIAPEERWAVEGDLFFPGGSLPFHFLAADGLAEHVRSESGGRDDYLYCEENDLLFENNWIVLPGPSVEEAAARAALEEWYRQTHLRQRGHRVAWGQMPRIDIRLGQAEKAPRSG